MDNFPVIHRHYSSGSAASLFMGGHYMTKLKIDIFIGHTSVILGSPKTVYDIFKPHS